MFADITSSTEKGPIDPTSPTEVSTDSNTSPSDKPTTQPQDLTSTQSQYQSTAADGGHDKPQVGLNYIIWVCGWNVIEGI